MRLVKILICVTLICGLVSCSRDPKLRAQRFVESGKQYADKGQYDAAVIQFRIAAKTDPQSAEAYYQLGTIELRLQNLREAYAALTKATELNPKHTSALTGLAAMKQLARKTDESRALLKEVLEIDGGNINARMLLGSASIQEGKYAQALEEFNEAKKLAPTDARVLTQTADCDVLLKQYPDAIKGYESAIAVNEKFLPAYLNLAQVYRVLGNSDQEIATLKSAIERNPKEVAPYLSAAEFYVRHRSNDQVSNLFNALRTAADNSAPASLSIAGFYRRIGAMEEAKAELQRLLTKYPKNDVARIELTEIHLNRQEWDDAEKLNAELLKDHPKNPQVRLFRSRLLFVRGNKMEAISSLEQLVHDVPDMALAHFYLGLARAEEGQFDRAIASFNDTIQRDPDLILSYVSLGELYWRQGNSKLALEFANKALARNPQLFSALLLQSNSYIQLADYAAASTKLQELAQTRGTNAVILERLGFVALRNKQFAEAERKLEESLRLQPDYVPAMADLASVYDSQHRGDEIVARFKQQIERAPKQIQFYEMLGNVYLHKADLSNAEQAFDDALKLDKDADAVHMQLASIYSATGRLPQAIDTLKGVVQRRSDYLAAYIFLGTLYERTGAIGAAQATYQKALERNGNYAPALNNLAWSYCENGGNLDMALSLAQKAKASMPTDPNVSDTLAWIQYKKGLYSSAAEELRYLAQRVPTNGLYQYHLGMALFKAGDPIEARKSLMRALEASPTAEYRQSAKTALAQLTGKAS